MGKWGLDPFGESLRWMPMAKPLYYHMDPLHMIVPVTMSYVRCLVNDADP